MPKFTYNLYCTQVKKMTVEIEAENISEARAEAIELAYTANWEDEGEHLSFDYEWDRVRESA